MKWHEGGITFIISNLDFRCLLQVRNNMIMFEQSAEIFNVY